MTVVDSIETEIALSMRHAILRFWTAMLVSLTGMPSADAHAFLSQAVPTVGGVTAAPLREIRLTFSEGIEPAFSGIELSTAAGQPISTGPAAIDPRNNTQLVLSLPGLGPGRYRVRWHVVSVDAHRTEGQFGFEVVMAANG